VLGVIPSGTGGDFRKSLGIPGVSTGAAHVVAQGNTRRIDVARIDFDGGGRRFFVNIADCGIGGEVVRRVNRSRFKSGGARGSAVFLWQSLRMLLTYGGRHARIDVDGDVISGMVRSIVVANGRYFGGGMHIAPHAALDDGLLDVVVVAATTRTQALAGIPSLYRGRHLGRREVQFKRGATVRIESDREPLLFDVEGEQVGQTPATITCLPSAIAVHAPLGGDQFQ
jgi:YegS/Rv2252/BmrU family lipid kinase